MEARIGIIPSVVCFLALSILLPGDASAAGRRSPSASSCSAEFHEHNHVDGFGGVSLAVYHRHGRCSPTHRRSRNSSFEVVELDVHRVQALLSRLRGNTESERPSTHRRDDYGLRSEEVTSSLSPGNFIGAGNYITSIGLGTPAAPHFMIVDTGSSLSWVQCQPCVRSCHAQIGPVFNPSVSTTYTTLNCSSRECVASRNTTLHRPGCSLIGVCLYEADYGDGSFSAGYLSKDTLNFAGTVIPNFVFGCGQDNQGLFGGSSGLIGLSKDELSMHGQLAPMFGGVFSYCLPSVLGAGGHLSFGPRTPSTYVFTPLLSLSTLNGSFYYLDLVDILVAEKSIPVSSTAYTANPTIIDSGTVISRLPSDIYAALTHAIAAALVGHARADSPVSLFDTCYLGSYMYLQPPTVRLVFGGNASITLPPRNVFYDFANQGLTCLAFAGSKNVAIIGNHQHQTFDVVYDVRSSNIGFATGGCS